MTAENFVVLTLFTGISTCVIFAGLTIYFNGDWPTWGQRILIGDIVLGLLSLLLFSVGLFIVLYKKIKVWAFVLALLLVVTMLSLLLFVLNRSNENQLPEVTNLRNFTGQDVFDRVNQYRKDNGVVELKLDDRLCNNLAQRYFDIKQGLEENVAHAKLDEWVKNNIPDNFVVGEDFAYGNTTDDLIKAWDGSPGHRLSLLNKKYVYGCSYASDGYGIMILGYTVANQKQAQAVQYNNVSTRTGKIISYHEWCTNKDISIYEGELVTRISTDGKTYAMTEGDWTCYENFLKNNR